MALIIDTNALSAILVGEPAVRPLLSEYGPPAITAIVIGEYRYGLRRSHRAAEIEEVLERVVGSVDVLPVDRRTADLYAEIRDELRSAGTPIPENDVWIAACARQSGGHLLSRDSHFDLVAGIRRLSW